MSGDVQPRKRKDKRRKKEESLGPEEPPVLPTVAAAKESSDDFNIHVHNDHGTGGGICAKLVFFVLLSILAVLIGMIFIEKRGLTDLDTAPTESRFAQIFDGWIDESFNHHEDDHHEAAIDDHDEHDEHEESEEHAIDDEDHHGSEEEEGHDEEDEHGDGHEEEEEEEEEEVEENEEEEEEVAASEEQVEETEEQATEEQVSEEQEQEEEQEETQEDVDDQEVEETQDDDDDDEEEEEDVEEEENQSVANEASNENDEQEEDNNDTNEDDADHEEDDIVNDTEEVEDDNQSTQNDDDDDINDVFEEDVSKENEIIEEESVEEIAEEQNEDDEEVIDNTAGEEEALQEEAEKEEEAQEESTGVAVKIGVGVALVVVAHIVLVRKWRSGHANVEKTPKQEEIVTDLTRRNTIVAPAPLEQIENDIEDEYSDEEEEESEEEIIIEPVKAKSTYMQLQSTYSRLPPENISTKTSLENKPAPRVFYYDEHQDDDEEEVEDEEEEEEEEEEGEEEEEEEEVEEQPEQEEEIEEDEEEGEDVEEVEEEEISDVDDEELLKKLEAKYGKLPSQKDNKADEDDDRFSSWKRIKVLPDSAEESEGSDDGRWAKKESIPADYQQKMKLAESNLRDNAELSLNLYTNLMETLPNNVYVKHGRAKALDHLAEKKRSNELLQDAISSYIDLLQSQNISDEMYLDVAERCIDRIRFRGHYNRAVEVHNKIIQRFPDTPKFRNQLAVTLLTSNRLTEAKKILHEVLSRWPNNGFAQVHYGFILKTRDNDLSAAIKYLKSGIESRETGVIDGRFYFHLGDALTRIGKNDEALKIYEDGVKHKVFLSKYQRSLYNIDRLTGRPWWSLNQTPYTWFFQLLEDKWTIIRNEGLALLNKAGFFKDEAENLRDTGEWKQFELFARGHKYTENCKKCPETCRLIENLPDAKNCRRGQVKFSVMHPGTHVWPHCGPSNCRLRAHLGLKVPPKTFIRVADETRSWSEGKVFIFDDSFEHEVWHNGTDVRLVLIIDVWHPELTAHEKRSLPAI